MSDPLPCKTCGERKPEVAFAKRQWKNCWTAGKQGQCLACSDSDPDKPTEGPKRTAEEAWAHFEAAESDGAVDGGVHRKKSVRLRAARPSADAAARAKIAYQELLLTYDVGAFSYAAHFELACEELEATLLRERPWSSFAPRSAPALEHNARTAAKPCAIRKCGAQRKHLQPSSARARTAQSGAQGQGGG